MVTLPQTNNCRKYLSALIFLLATSLAMANAPLIRSHLIKSTDYNLTKLLPGQSLHQVHQDSRGLFWILTGEGLYNYDGNQIYPVSWEDVLPNFSQIRMVGEDNVGRIWLRQTSDDRPAWRAFNHYTRTEIPAVDLQKVLGAEVTDLSISHKGDLLFLTNSGELWQHKNASSQQLSAELPAGCRFVTPTYSTDFIWLQSDSTGSLLGMNLLSGNFKSLRLDQPFLAYPAGKDLVLLTNKKRGLLTPWGDTSWTSLQNLIPDFNPESDEWNKDYEQSLYLEDRDELWISFKNTLYVGSLNDAGKPLISYDKPLFAGSGLFDGNRGSVLLTGAEGFSQLLTYTCHFRKIAWNDPLSNSPDQLSAVTALVESKEGIVYYGTPKGIASWNPLTLETIEVLESRGLSAMVNDESRQMLWAISATELIKLNTRTNKALRFPLPEAMRGTWLSMEEIGYLLYIGGERGLYVFNTGNNEFSEFSGYNGYDELRTATINGFFRESPSLCWVLSSTGIYGLDPEKGITWQQQERRNPQLTEALKNVRFVLQDTEDVYWMASREGLVFWDKNRDIYHLFSEADKLPTNRLQSVWDTGDDELWLSSDYGLIAFDKNTHSSRYYTVKDGISDNAFVPGAHSAGLDGTLYFGTRNGITAFQPESVSYEAIDYGDEFPLSLMSAVVYSTASGKREDLSRFYNNGVIALQPEDVAMEIHFAVPLLPDIKKVKLSYQLGNSKEEWIPFPGYALKLAPKPGQDTIIKIKVNAQGVPSEETIISIPIRYDEVDFISPWYYALPILLLLLTLLWYSGYLPGLAGLRAAPKNSPPFSVSGQAEPQKINQVQPADDKVRLFTGVAHELRTPLSLILGPAGYLSQNSKLNKQEQAMLDTIRQNADILQQQVEEIMLISALDENQSREQIEFFDPGDWFETRLSGFDHLAEKKRIYFGRRYNWGKGKQLYHHKQWLGIIAGNLVSNAFKFTRNGGNISLEAGVEDGTLYIYCSDTGQGIHPEDQPHVFERYFQSRRRNAPLEGGSGIGLALVKELTQRMGGTVTFKSIWGEGSDFRVRIPLPEVPEGESLVANSDNSELSAVAKNKNISGQLLLLVEDNPDFQNYLRLLLGKSFEVRIAANGREALTLLKGGLRPALVLTDLMMPEMDGYQLLEALRAEADWQEIPVAVLSVRDNAEDRARALELGAGAYIAKPFEGSELLSQLSGLIVDKEEPAKEISVAATVAVEEDGSGDWLEQLAMLVNQEMTAENFNVDRLASMMYMSRTAFYKKVQDLTGMTPNQYIMECRLQKARSILEEQPKTKIRKLVRMVGLKHEGYFTKNFIQRFGYSPSDFRS